MDLVSGGTYEITTKLRDRQTTSFDNYLRVYQTPQQAEGIYRCIPVSSMDGPIQDRNITRSSLLLAIRIIIIIILIDWYTYHTVTNYFIAMYTVGDSSSITCTLDLVLIYAWYDEDGNTVVNGDELSYSANDSIHHKTFLCSGQNIFTLDTEALYIKFVINGNNVSVIILLIMTNIFSSS